LVGYIHDTFIYMCVQRKRVMTKQGIPPTPCRYYIAMQQRCCNAISKQTQSLELKTMKPIVGEISYKDMTPEDIARFREEAEVMRAEAIRDMFLASYRALAHTVVRVTHGFRNVIANPGVHPTPKAH